MNDEIFYLSFLNPLLLNSSCQGKKGKDLSFSDLLALAVLLPKIIDH